MTTIWTPQPKQAAFMRRKEYECLYGGAAGGGKSEAIIIEALRQVHIPHYRALILRKTYPELAELVDKSLKYYPQICKGARYNVSTHTWTFPSGAKVTFGSLQHSTDKVKYQGRAFDLIVFDELTHFTYDEFVYLMSRNRPNGPGTRVYIRCTANPGGVGHGWVKERYITPSPPMTPIATDTEWIDGEGKTQTVKQHRIFVPSTVFDNEELLRNDPMYVARLASMPEAEKKALLYGDWDSFSGQVFTEWRNDPAHYADRLNTHVIDPFIVPQGWGIYCGMDWGYSRPFSIGWYAVDYEKRIYRIREFYGCTGTPNQGVMMDPSEVARQMKAIEADDPNLRGRKIRRIGDPAIWGTQGTESIGSLFEREGVYFEKADHARIDGKMQMHHRLSFDDNGVPMLYIFSGCKHFIRTVPALVYSQTNVEDVDTDGEDHIYDECRYVCMAHPIAPRAKKKPENKGFDPLSEDISYGRYDFYLRG